MSDFERRDSDRREGFVTFKGEGERHLMMMDVKLKLVGDVEIIIIIIIIFSIDNQMKIHCIIPVQ